jgi:hypothetical protein
MTVLLPINSLGGNNIRANIIGTGRNLTQGLDILTLSNIQPKYYSRLWAHCILAVGLILWTCYVVVQELQNFVRVRQTFITSPQHRIRASAATVLVQALPRKYMDRDKLAELFDVYPGGIRNIWINRNYEQLSDLVDQRNGLAKKLEEAESDLIRKCWRAHQKKAKANGYQLSAIDTAASTGDGLSANDPGQVHHSIDDAVEDINRSELELVEDPLPSERGRLLGAVAQGFHNIGRGIAGHGSINKSRLAGPFSRLRKNKSEVEANDTKHEKRFDPTQEETVNRDSAQLEEKGKVLPYDPYYNEDSHLEPKWKKYIEEKDRPTCRVSIRWKWCPSWMNPVATKVDTIWYCRREVARLNRLIEEQQRPEAEAMFPKLKSAFIQFNNQAAAHMACQSVAHHSPNYMTPRLVEIAPNDVLWENMSISGWQQYLRTGGVFLVCTSLVLLWTPLIAVSSAISQLDALRKTKGFTWLQGIPGGVISIIQGILPVVLVALLILLLGLLLRYVIKFQGAPTKMLVELSVQKYFFGFVFIQYFVVVTISSAIVLLFDTVKSALTAGDVSVFIIPRLLAQNIPQSTNYFLSSMLLQSFAQSAGGLLQPGALWLLGWASMTNSLAREKFLARRNVRTMDWGTTYPRYTVLACVALIYSVISPLILPLSIIGFGIWWISTRYQMLYVFKYTTDTGGLLFPAAIMQLFYGIFVLEMALIGYFIIVTTGTAGDSAPRSSIIPMTAIMAIVFGGTILFYFALKRSFGPLFEYLPITLEDDAVARDEEFERLLSQRHSTQEEGEMMQNPAEGGPEDHDDDPRPEDERLDSQSRLDLEAQGQALRTVNWSERGPAVAGASSLPPPLQPNGTNEGLDETALNSGKKDGLMTGLELLRPQVAKRGSWADRRRRSATWKERSPSPNPSHLEEEEHDGSVQKASISPDAPRVPPLDSRRHRRHGKRSRRRLSAGNEAQMGGLDGAGDVQGKVASHPLAAPLGFISPNQDVVDARNDALAAEAYQLYGNIPDDLEDLTRDERDALLSRAFRHSALRAKRPCIWLPRDPLGVSDDEVRNTERFTSWVWISNEKQLLDAKGKCVYKGPPPDFDKVDLIQL